MANTQQIHIVSVGPQSAVLQVPDSRRESIAGIRRDVSVNDDYLTGTEFEDRDYALSDVKYMKGRGNVVRSVAHRSSLSRSASETSKGMRVSSSERDGPAYSSSDILTAPASSIRYRTR